MDTPAGRADLPRTTPDDASATWLLRSIRPLAQAAVRRHFDMTLTGVDNVPAQGPVILSGNHIGFLDGPLTAVMSPRPAQVLTKAEIFHGALGWFLSSTGQIPVHRGEPDPASVRSALRVLREGGVLSIFPEGGRGSGELDSCRPGVGYFALVTGAPVVPLCVLGTRVRGGTLNSLPSRGSRIVFTYGAPVSFEPRPWPRRVADVREATSRIRNAMLATTRSALEATGMQLPGPVPEGDTP